MAIRDHYHRNVCHGAAHDGPHEPVHGTCVHGGAPASVAESVSSRGKLLTEATRVWIIVLASRAPVCGREGSHAAETGVYVRAVE